MLRSPVLLALFITTSFGTSQWNFNINNDGTVTYYSAQRSGPLGTLQLSGLQLKGNPVDCAIDSEHTTCKEWTNLRIELKKDGSCINSWVKTLDPVGSLVSLIATWNTTGHLYGGPEQYHQNWPLDDFVYDHYSMVTKQQDYQGIADPYWLSSDGYFFYVHPETSLFIEQNKEYEHYLKFIAQNADPYPGPLILIHNTTVCTFDNAREAHTYAVEHYLGKPTGIPDEKMIRFPIWSTWARYKKDINEVTVKEFAQEILDNGFPNSQIEIDDLWETCYGSHEFDKDKFPNMKDLTDWLKEKGFRVTLWIHPFVNVDCQPYYDNAIEKNYLVRNASGTASTWWNGEGGSVDFTNEEAVQWWTGVLKRLQEENGIDSFKFDAGETSFAPGLPEFTADQLLQPNIYTEKYVETVAQFGDMIEVRVGHGTQRHPFFVRMQDKDSRWDLENGLPTLLTTLFEMNMVGYPFALPDMVGGNGYGDDGPPEKELFIRWLQANVFMPSIQFSYVPWDYDQETIDISKKYVELHATYADRIIRAMRKAVDDGTPVNTPIWWIAPDDPIAQTIRDEFLLDEVVLVAPVLEKGAVSRDIYLPQGVWMNPERPDEIHSGPTWLKDYPAALDELPYFVKK